MPARSFGRTVRYRRTKLGLSQARLGDLVGRSQSTIRSWEKDQSVPTDTKVLETLSAVLGVDQRMLFQKAGEEFVPSVETSPTIEQELATLSPEASEREPEQLTVIRPEDFTASPPEVAEPPPPTAQPGPAYAKPAVSYVASPRADNLSYMEDNSQRQLYRLRYLATIVLLVALGVALLWAAGQSFGAIGDWWEEFFGNLRL